MLQLSIAWLMRDFSSFKTWKFWIFAYCIGLRKGCVISDSTPGGTVNHALFLAIHELSHNLGFKSVLHNKLFSILACNLPIAFPYAASFKVNTLTLLR